MKKLYFILCFQLLLVAARAQVALKGINYQAAAHNPQGNLLRNQQINLKIYLFGNENDKRVNHYSEIHQVTTNQQGLFNLVIGEDSGSKANMGWCPGAQKTFGWKLPSRTKGIPVSPP